MKITVNEPLRKDLSEVLFTVNLSLLEVTSITSNFVDCGRLFKPFTNSDFDLIGLVWDIISTSKTD